MTKYYVGIDPGRHGAIAVITHLGRVALCEDLPYNEYDGLFELDVEAVVATLSQFPTEDTTVALEKVFGRQGDVPSSAFTFGKHYGSIQACISISGMRRVDVSPQAWKRALGLILPGASKTKEPTAVKKERSRQAALAIWPNCKEISRKMDEGRAEALLIAKYLCIINS